MGGAVTDSSRAEIAVFRCALPPIQSAIKVGLDGMRVQFDIPESEMAEAVRLIAWRGRILCVRVEVEDGRE